MAESLFSSQDQYNCSICLDLMQDPVTIPCGHSYCMSCIKDYWNSNTMKNTNCPQCRQNFTQRPALNRNTMLAEIMENLRKAELQAPPSDSVLAKPGDIECDFCIERKCRALKSCLECRASYCEAHLQPHYDIPALKRHKLAKPTNMPTCQKHDKLLEVFCQTDQKCICMLCLMDEHKGHDTISCATERDEKQVKLEADKRIFEEKRKEKELALQKMKKAMQTHVQSAQQAIKDAESEFKESIRILEKRRSDVIERIRDQEKAEMDQLNGLNKQLENEIALLKGHEDAVDKLLQTEDNIYFLQNFKNTPTPAKIKDFSLPLLETIYFGDVNKLVSEFKERLETFCKQQGDEMLTKISKLAKGTIKIGDKVRVKSSVNTPKYNWGSNVTHKSTGIVKAVDAETLVVSFSGHNNWKGIISEMELVTDESDQDNSLKIGDKVRVKDSVDTPVHKWGGVTHQSVGIVKAVEGENMTVDFPEYSSWKGIVSEMELMSSDNVSVSNLNCNIQIGDKVRVKSSVVTPKHQWGGITHKSVGVVKAITGDNMTVDFPDFKGWKGVISEMEVIPSKSSEASIGIGDRVQVKATVISPKHGWGKISHASVGVVKALKGEDVVATFPTQENWHGVVSEMELVSTNSGVSNFKTGDKVRIKSSVETPKYKWGSINHKSVGTITGIKVMVDFPEQSNWAGDSSEMELVP